MSAPDALTIGDRQVRLRIRRNPRARRFVLRLDAAQGEARLTAPRRASDRAVIRFLKDHEGWIADALNAAPAPMPIEHGAIMPFRGEPHRLVHTPSLGRRVSAADGAIQIGGDAAHLPRRLMDWLRNEARRDLGDRARAHAETLDQRFARVRIADPRSRWGSCSTTGTISFSWRLILAPDFARDYVAAHEAAHLIEMNHSPAFWAVVERLTPHRHAAQKWLRAEGSTLRRVFAGV